MRDKDFYAQILGITYPWFVGEVKLQLQEGEVTVYLELHPDYALRREIGYVYFTFTLGIDG